MSSYRALHLVNSAILLVSYFKSVVNTSILTPLLCPFFQLELLHEIESPDEFVMDLLESMPDSAPTAPQ